MYEEAILCSWYAHQSNSINDEILIKFREMYRVDMKDPSVLEHQAIKLDVNKALEYPDLWTLLIDNPHMYINELKSLAKQYLGYKESDEIISVLKKIDPHDKDLEFIIQQHQSISRTARNNFHPTTIE